MILNYKGIELEVDFDYQEGRGGDYEYPPEPPYIQINEILWEGKDCYELIDALGGIQEIEETILEKLS